jgi:hypothetical protein
MKRALFICAFITMVAFSAHATTMVMMPATGVGTGNYAITGAIAIPASGVTEVGAKFAWGVNSGTDAYGKLALESMSGGSATVLGGGVKGLFYKSTTAFPVDMAWLGDLNYISQSGATVLGLMGGVIFSKRIDRLTPYGIVGLAYYNASAGGASTSGSGIALGGGVSYVIAPRMSIKGEVLISNSQGSNNTALGGGFTYNL